MKLYYGAYPLPRVFITINTVQFEYEAEFFYNGVRAKESDVTVWVFEFRHSLVVRATAAVFQPVLAPGSVHQKLIRGSTASLSTRTNNFIVSQNGSTLTRIISMTFTTRY